ncbi:hypothetical protein [Candidatus Magnetobacterium casense]|uniref:PARP-type domain-containing protein n=1 Tax=Candidatus Magnetobacterium casense TaxID=1455061 RepID=A0ABS6RZ51_9BACT|nr:hypothetical protein [Candidatus Magnetobacterium casensis]MBV6341468.1 hypothetical protein [Candidatus Magnetobacterium casensis]
MELVIRQSSGFILSRHKARKEHSCQICRKPILKGTECYTRIVAGSGVGGFIDAEKIHTWCA